MINANRKFPTPEPAIANPVALPLAEWANQVWINDMEGIADNEQPAPTTIDDRKQEGKRVVDLERENNPNEVITPPIAKGGEREHLYSLYFNE